VLKKMEMQYFETNNSAAKVHPFAVQIDPAN
jgi:hypothetical protein